MRLCRWFCRELTRNHCGISTMIGSTLIERESVGISHLNWIIIKTENNPTQRHIGSNSLMNGSHPAQNTQRRLDNNKLDNGKKRSADTFDSSDVLHVIEFWMRLSSRSRCQNIVNNSRCDWNINEANAHPHKKVPSILHKTKAYTEMCAQWKWRGAAGEGASRAITTGWLKCKLQLKISGNCNRPCEQVVVNIIVRNLLLFLWRCAIFSAHK